MEILTRHYKNLISYANCKGITSRKVKILEQDSFMSIEKYLVEFQELMLTSGDSHFGLHFGSFLNLEALGAVYEISLASTKISQAIQLWSDYAKSNFPIISFDTFIEGDDLILELNSKISNPKISNQILDTIFTFVYRELELMIGKESVQANLPYSDLTAYNKWFRRPVKKGLKHRFIFDLETAKGGINKKSKKEITFLLPAFLKVIESEDTKSKAFSSQVRNMTLNMWHSKWPSLAQVARQFMMTERTLQRKLKAEDMTFRIITNNIKKDLHSYLQKGEKIKTQDMAYFLGYSSSSSLLHAIQNW